MGIDSHIVDMLMRRAESVCRNHHDAEDLVQDVCLKVVSANGDLASFSQERLTRYAWGVLNN